MDTMLFFDDLPHNIRTAEAIGVGASVLVSGGMQLRVLHSGCKLLKERRRVVPAGSPRAFRLRLFAARWTTGDVPLKQRIYDPLKWRREHCDSIVKVTIEKREGMLLEHMVLTEFSVDIETEIRRRSALGK